nr:MAG TPA: large terminase [Caudoviricetes sp.]
MRAMMMTLLNPDLSPEKNARLLYWRGFTCAEIARLMGIPDTTVRSWKTREGWDRATTARRIGEQIDVRLAVLVAKDEKSEKDYNEMDKLAKILERTARIERYEDGGNEADLNPNVRKRNEAKRRKAKARGDSGKIDDEMLTELKREFHKRIYPHQKAWYEHSKKYEMRQYVKSRQIGATFYFALEALLTALDTGKNQIFLSASKSQAHIFRSNIVAFVDEVLGIQLKGEHIKLAPRTTLYFLGTNSNTAQSYSGDLYIDEYFWIPQFKKLKHVASGMTVHDDRRITYFSTPSTVTHEAYPLWTGAEFNKDRPKSEHIDLDVSHKALKDGRLCEDGYFRQVITIEDAINSGFDLVTMEKLWIKFPPGQFENLLMCQFVNDTDSIFKMAELQRCMVDAWTLWKDYTPLSARPLDDAPVWIGYDPSRSQDDASLVVIAPPRVEGGVFRIVDKQSFNGLDFDGQAQKIREFCSIYNVANIAIDATGIGQAVYDLVRQFYPRAKKIIYTVEAKNEMVLKAKQLIHHGRLQWDAGWTDIAHAFLTIHQAQTGSGRQVTYKASRTATTGHADLAWATMHALINDPLGEIATAGFSGKRGFARIF